MFLLGVIQRVSNLFKGYPELIAGFNTFLPPGYKIEVQRNNEGYAFQVSVSMPSPTGTVNSDPQQQRSAMILKGSGTINTSAQNQQTQSQPPSQPLPLAQHMPPVAPQPPPTAPVVHHASSYNSQAPTYPPLSLSAAQAAVNHALQGHTDTPQNQPVEFNHAINYVNKIKVSNVIVLCNNGFYFTLKRLFTFTTKRKVLYLIVFLSSFSRFVCFFLVNISPLLFSGFFCIKFVILNFLNTNDYLFIV